MKILYITREHFPSFRADIKSLFGKYLPEQGIYASIIAQRSNEDSYLWEGGELFLYKKTSSKIINNIKTLLLETFGVIKNIKNYDAVQVRDKVTIALICLIIAKFNKKPFFFWMSWPFPEDDLEKVKIQGTSLGFFRLIYFFVRGYLLKFFQYKIVFPFSNHIFVQSEAMKEWLSEKGIDKCKMTPVPMGVDLDEIHETSSLKKFPQSLENKKNIAYIGSLRQTRRIDILLDIFKKILSKEQNTHLLLIGGTPLGENINWVHEKITQLGLSNYITITGWIPQTEAWAYLRMSHLALNLIPRNIVFDTSSPTKIIEYAALGVPCVVTDNPDQKDMIKKLNCGICVPYDSDAIVDAVLRILQDPELSQYYSKNGKNTIGKYRSYSVVSRELAQKYADLLMETQSCRGAI